MKMKSLLAGALALALLAGCSGAADPDDLAYQAADMKRNSTIVTVDGGAVTAEEYLFWLMNAISTQKYMGNLSDDTAWEDTISVNGEELPTADALMQDALETAKLYRVIEDRAVKAGCSLTEEQEQEVNDTLANMTEQLGGEDVLQEWLEARCITMEGFLHLNRVYYLNENLRTKMEEDGDLTVTDEDLHNFVEEQGFYAAKHILLSTVDMEGTPEMREDGSYGYPKLDAETIAAKKAQAEDFLEQIRQADNPTATFDALMNQYSEDGRDPSTGELYAADGYTYIYSGQMVPEFENGALALEVGEVSEIVESDYGYHIIMRIPVDEEQARGDCTSEYKFSMLTQQWLEEAQVKTTKAYDNLDPKTFYDRLNQVVEARQAARASASPAPEEDSEGTESEQPQESSAAE